MNNNMNKLKNLLVAVIAITSLSTYAFAGSYTLGVTGSIMTVNASGNETDTLTAGGAAVADTSVRKKNISDDTMTGSVFAEFTSATSYPITIGLEYTPGTADMGGKFKRTDSELSRTGTANTTALSVTRNAEASATNFSALYVEAPIWGMLYVRAGLANMDVSYENFISTAAANGGNYVDTQKALTGVNLGAGLKGNFDGGMLWKLSYEETDYDSITVTSQGNSVAANSNTVKADLDTSAIRFSLAKTF
jgi:hypothetical protein